MKCLPHILFILLIAVSCTTLSADEKKSFADEIQGLLRNAVEKEKRWPGVVVGTVDAKGTHVFAEGNIRVNATNKVNGDTIFQIGSVTKTFTTLLLQLMVDRGEVELDEPVAKLLPPSAIIPKRGKREITLADLATHTSGLPRMPFKTPPRGPVPPVTIDDVFKFLSDYELTRDIGARYEYSNLGVGLLGHALSLKAGTNYEALVLKEICEPLKLKSTRITLSSEMKSRLAIAHTASGEALQQWRQPGLLAAGAICSSANDLLKYISAQLGLVRSPLLEAMQKTHVARHAAVREMKVALGWHARMVGGSELVSHSGSTIGYHSFVAFDKRNRCGIVVLVNSANEIGELPFKVLEELNKNAKVEK
jgi:serine-type D-Ala-D-Ala carboxypeptidase/endopeptidase